jgi:hypothetical protein
MILIAHCLGCRIDRHSQIRSVTQIRPLVVQDRLYGHCSMHLDFVQIVCAIEI